MHKAGFVNIIGKPNAGKSTLMNALVGEKLSIVTPKAQTTRHRIISILNGDDYQIVFSDTPGIIEPSYKMQECMMSFVEQAYKDADILIFLADATENPDIKNIPTDLLSTKIPMILVLNKIDVSNQEIVETIFKKWGTIFPNSKQLAISALRNFNISALTSLIVELLPESPPYYDKDTLTDRSQRFFISEIIREKVLMQYHKEIPYCVEIDIDEFKEEENIFRISALIYVVRSSQKIILIGEGGKAIKRLGTDARKDIEAFLGKQVFLQLFVKVQKNWRDNTLLLKKFGYIN